MTRVPETWGHGVMRDGTEVGMDGICFVAPMPVPNGSPHSITENGGFFTRGVGCLSAFVNFHQKAVRLSRNPRQGVSAVKSFKVRFGKQLGENRIEESMMVATEESNSS